MSYEFLWFDYEFTVDEREFTANENNNSSQISKEKTYPILTSSHEYNLF